MEQALFTTFPYLFTLKPLLFGEKAMEFHGIRPGTSYEVLPARDEFKSLWKQFPNQRALDPIGHRILRIEPFEFYEHQFGYDYRLLSLDAIDQDDHLILSLDLLIFLTVKRIMHAPEMLQVKQDFLLLMQKLGVEPFSYEKRPEHRVEEDFCDDDPQQ